MKYTKAQWITLLIAGFSLIPGLQAETLIYKYKFKGSEIAGLSEEGKVNQAIQEKGFVVIDFDASNDLVKRADLYRIRTGKAEKKQYHQEMFLNGQYDVVRQQTLNGGIRAVWKSDKAVLMGDVDSQGLNIGGKTIFMAESFSGSSSWNSVFTSGLESAGSGTISMLLDKKKTQIANSKAFTADELAKSVLELDKLEKAPMDEEISADSKTMSNVKVDGGELDNIQIGFGSKESDNHAIFSSIQVGRFGSVDYIFPNRDGQKGNIMATDGQGNIYWQPLDNLVNTSNLIKDGDNRLTDARPWNGQFKNEQERQQAKGQLGVGAVPFNGFGTGKGTAVEGNDDRLNNDRNWTGKFTSPQVQETAKANLGIAKVASSGSYNDLNDLPDLTNLKANVVTGNTAGTVCAGDDPRLYDSRKWTGLFSDNTAKVQGTNAVLEQIKSQTGKDLIAYLKMMGADPASEGAILTAGIADGRYLNINACLADFIMNTNVSVEQRKKNLLRTRSNVGLGGFVTDIVENGEGDQARFEFESTNGVFVPKQGGSRITTELLAEQDVKLNKNMQVEGETKLSKSIQVDGNVNVSTDVNINGSLRHGSLGWVIDGKAPKPWMVSQLNPEYLRQENMLGEINTVEKKRVARNNMGVLSRAASDDRFLNVDSCFSEFVNRTHKLDESDESKVIPVSFEERQKDLFRCRYFLGLGAFIADFALNAEGTGFAYSLQNGVWAPTVTGARIIHHTTIEKDLTIFGCANINKGVNIGQDGKPTDINMFLEDKTHWKVNGINIDEWLGTVLNLNKDLKALAFRDTVANQHIDDGAVTSSKIADGNVTNADLANNSVTTEKIADGNVTNADLANNSVTTDKISDGNVTNADLANNSVTTDKISDGNVTNADLANDAVTTDKIADGNVANADLANNAVTTDKIADGNVANADLANNAVTTDKIADGNVANADLANNAVTTDKIADATIGTADMNAGPINADPAAGQLGSWVVAPTRAAARSALNTISKEVAEDRYLNVENPFSEIISRTTKIDPNDETQVIAVTQDDRKLDLMKSRAYIGLGGFVSDLQEEDDPNNAGQKRFVYQNLNGIIQPIISQSRLTAPTLVEQNLAVMGSMKLGVDTQPTDLEMFVQDKSHWKVNNINIDTWLISQLNLQDLAFRDTVAAQHIDASAVTTDKINAAAVTSTKIANGAVAGGAGGVILDNSITHDDIATGAVRSDEILDESITSADIGTGAVASDEILDNSITSADIGTGAVASDEILDGSVGTVDITDNSLLTTDLSNTSFGSWTLTNNPATARTALDLYSKTQLQTEGEASVHYNNLLYKPFSWDAGNTRWTSAVGAEERHVHVHGMLSSKFGLRVENTPDLTWLRANLGGFMSWNRSGAQTSGMTSFYANRGSGGGGFEFLDCAPDGQDDPAVKPIAIITREGALSTKSSISSEPLKTAGSITPGSDKPLMANASGTIFSGAFGSNAGQFSEGNHNHNYNNLLAIPLTWDAGNTRWTTRASDGTDRNVHVQGVTSTNFLTSGSGLQVQQTPDLTWLRANQGGFMGWNRSGAYTSGVTSFYSNRGGGGGGFEFVDCAPDGQADTEIKSLAVINREGELWTKSFIWCDALKTTQPVDENRDLPLLANLNGTIIAGSFGTGADQFARGDHGHGALANLNTVSTNYIDNDAITAVKIVDGAVGSAEIFDGSVQTIDIANGAVTLDKLATNSVDATKIIDGAVGSAEIFDGTIQINDLNGSSFGGWTMTSNAATARTALDVYSKANLTTTGEASVSYGNLWGQPMNYSGGNARWETTGRVFVNGYLYTNDWLVSDKLKSSVSVLGSDLPLLANSSGTIIAGAFGTGATDFARGNHAHGALSNLNTVSTNYIDDGAVTLAKLAANSVDDTKIIDGAVGTAEIFDNSVQSVDIRNGTIQPEDVAMTSAIGDDPKAGEFGSWVTARTIVDAKKALHVNANYLVDDNNLSELALPAKAGAARANLDVYSTDEIDAAFGTRDTAIAARYTKTELNTSGQSAVHWNNITDVPSQVSAPFAKAYFKHPARALACRAIIRWEDINSLFYIEGASVSKYTYVELPDPETNLIPCNHFVRIYPLGYKSVSSGYEGIIVYTEAKKKFANKEKATGLDVFYFGTKAQTYSEAAVITFTVVRDSVDGTKRWLANGFSNTEWEAFNDTTRITTHADWGDSAPHATLSNHFSDLSGGWNNLPAN